MGGTEAYELILEGELGAAKGKGGLLDVRGSALEDYKRRDPAISRPPDCRTGAPEPRGSCRDFA